MMVVCFTGYNNLKKKLCLPIHWFLTMGYTYIIYSYKHIERVLSFSVGHYFIVLIESFRFLALSVHLTYPRFLTEEYTTVQNISSHSPFCVRSLT